MSLGTRQANGRITPNTGSGMVTVGDRGSCSADSGVRGSSDRESGATSAGGNLSDSTADGTLYTALEILQSFPSKRRTVFCKEGGVRGVIRAYRIILSLLLFEGIRVYVL